MYKSLGKILQPLMLLMILWAVSCSKSNEHISGSLVSHSDCKSGEKSSLTTGPADTLSCVEYHYLPESKTLKVNHLNAGFNCCPGELSCHVSLENGKLTISEAEEAPQCSCMCLFDLNIEIPDLEPGIYTLRLIEPYRSNQAELSALIDLNTSPSGTFCVIRKDYPWGMSILR